MNKTQEGGRKSHHRIMGMDDEDGLVKVVSEALSELFRHPDAPEETIETAGCDGNCPYTEKDTPPCERCPQLS